LTRLWIPAVLIAAVVGTGVAVYQPPAHAARNPAPSFSVHTFDGKTVRLAELHGRPVIVDFWATWCRPCRANMPHLSGIQDRYRGQGLVVIGLSVDDDDATVRRFADQLGVRFRVGMADERTLDDFGPIRSIPTTFFIDRQGEVVRRVVGYIDEETMDGYAKEILGAATGAR
jgi:thiol-disulfide isomerase/thioredoxin